MSQTQDEDFELSHAVLNVLWSSYKGMFVFLSALARLEGPASHSAALTQTRAASDQLHAYWQRWTAGESVMTKGATTLSPDASHLVNLLATHRGHLVWSLREVASKATLEALVRDPAASRLRIAAFCQEAYSREHFIQGLIAYGEVTRSPEIVSRWRSQMASAQEQVARANLLIEWLPGAGPMTPESAGPLLDETLLLPLTFSLRILDVDRLSGALRGRFGYAEAGIEESQAGGWQQLGLDPYSAGQWSLTGIGPRDCQRWLAAGVIDPYVAAHFYWRGLDFDRAQLWLQASYTGRAAAAWMRAGGTVQDALHWRGQGVEHPDQLR